MSGARHFWERTNAAAANANRLLSDDILDAAAANRNVQLRVRPVQRPVEGDCSLVAVSSPTTVATLARAGRWPTA